MTKRLLLILAALAALTVGVVLLGGDRYELTLTTENASQLVPGNVVSVAGVQIGSVEEIVLTEDGQAQIRIGIDSDRYEPLHEGTTAAIQYGSLSSVADRVVAITPGPDNAAELDDGAVLGAERVDTPVELDSTLNALDRETRSALQGLFHGFAVSLDGSEPELRAGLKALSPALAQTSETLNELRRDDARLEQLIVASAAVASTVAERPTELERALVNGSDVAGRLASETTAIKTLLEQSPRTLREANTTLVNLRAALGDLRPTLRLAEPTATRLAPVLRRLGPVTDNARPALSDLRALLPDLTRVVEGLPPLERSATPAFRSTVTALRDSEPVIRGALPFLPDVLNGFLGGFGGETGGYYDANGVYTRIGLHAGESTLAGLATGLNPLTLLETRGNVNRCPGGATQSAPDGSNPFESPHISCDPEQSPP